jgi:hypothetical protein
MLQDNIVPQKDNANIGVISVPVMMAPISDFADATMRASLYSRDITRTKSRIFERPIFIKGIGRGSTISTRYKLVENAVIIAMI